MKKIISILLIVFMLFSVTGCGKKSGDDTITLATPANVTVSDNGLITWDAVENATSYTVVVNGKTYNTSETRLPYSDIYTDATITVTATNGKNVSEPATYSYVGKTVTVTISGQNYVRSGKSSLLTASVEGANVQGVTWSIVSGGEYATISENGRITATEVTESKTVTVRATSKADGKSYAEKNISIRAKDVLTQDMLDVFDDIESISFDGSVTISLYDIDPTSTKVESTHVVPDVTTAMDGTNWYAKYSKDATYNISQNIYIKNVGGYACEIGVDYMNKEIYSPVKENGAKIAWADSGYINSFKDLNVSDFVFDEDLWMWRWNGDISFVQKVMVSAIPYDFVPKNLCLVIEDGEVMGIYSVSENDYTLATGYRAVQELTSLVNYTDVEVPTIPKFEYDEDAHAPLKEALQNMKSLKSYKVDLLIDDYNMMVGGETVSGYYETITEDACYFEAYSGTSLAKTGTTYGYRKVNDNLYNAFVDTDDKSGFRASRAYEASFDEAKPGFNFAPEIFNKYGVTESVEGSGIMDGRVYFVNDIMTGVASELYQGIGNDIQLYGIFAKEGKVNGFNGGNAFTPCITVKKVNGNYYITGAYFYYYLGYMYGIVVISFSEFDTATIDAEVSAKINSVAVRNVPVSYDELSVVISGESGSTTDDYEMNALEYIASVFDKEAYDTAKALTDETEKANAINACKATVANKIPFFGSVLGDTYAFSMSQMYLPSGESVMKSALQMYYDVPLDSDYSITSSLQKVEELLVSEGFVREGGKSYYTKDNVAISVVDSSLDLFIYVWKI